MWEHTVGILIGGQSRRMGSAKHKIELKNGISMLQMMLDFASNTARQTVIVGGEIDGLASINDCFDNIGSKKGHLEKPFYGGVRGNRTGEHNLIISRSQAVS